MKDHTANLTLLSKRTWIQSEENGWHDRWDKIILSNDDSTDHIMAKLALITSEVAEAMEDVRNGGMEPLSEMQYEAQPNGTNKPVGFASEMADVVIRVMDLCEMIGVDLTEAINVKLDYNDSRGYMHGGKKV